MGNGARDPTPLWVMGPSPVGAGGDGGMACSEERRGENKMDWRKHSSWVIVSDVLTPSLVVNIYTIL